MSIVPHVHNPNLIRGKMTDAERAEIERLCATMTKPTSGKIARKMNRHVSTVNWYRLRNGLIERKPQRAPRIYVRNGREVHPYSEDHDSRLLELRTAGKVFREIGEILTAEFGIERDAHSVQVRMTLLAAAPDEQIAAPPRHPQISAPHQE